MPSSKAASTWPKLWRLRPDEASMMPPPLGPNVVPPRPDVPPVPSVPEPPARWSIPAGGIFLVAAGAAMVLSASLPWWRASVTVSFENAEGGSRSLGDFAGTASWPGLAVGLLGVAVVLLGLASLGTPRRRTRRLLASVSLVATLSVLVAAGWALGAGDSMVASRADRSVQAQDLGMSSSVTGFAAEVGEEADLAGARVAFEGQATSGVHFALAAAAVAVAGGVLLLRAGGEAERSGPETEP